jgi:hypothetical protein
LINKKLQLILPETKGKSPEDMKAYFLGQHHHLDKEGAENKAYSNP